MPLDIYQVAANSLRMNDLLRSFDVEYQRSQGSCLGTATGLEHDAVRLVLTDHELEARKYFEAVISLAEAAIEARETWIYDTVPIASLFAYRLAYIAAWALRSESARSFAGQALTTFEQIATPSDYLVEHPNHALTTTVLLAIHGEMPERFLPKLPIRRRCVEDHVWCRCFDIACSFARGLDVVTAIDDFFESRVRAKDRYKITNPDFPLSSAISLAFVRSAAHASSAGPFEVIKTLLGPAPN